MCSLYIGLAANSRERDEERSHSFIDSHGAHNIQVHSLLYKIAYTNEMVPARYIDDARIHNRVDQINSALKALCVLCL